MICLNRIARPSSRKSTYKSLYSDSIISTKILFEYTFITFGGNFFSSMDHTSKFVSIFFYHAHQCWEFLNHIWCKISWSSSHMRIISNRKQLVRENWNIFIYVANFYWSNYSVRFATCQSYHVQFIQFIWLRIERCSLRVFLRMRNMIESITRLKITLLMIRSCINSIKTQLFSLICVYIFITRTFNHLIFITIPYSSDTRPREVSKMNCSWIIQIWGYWFDWHWKTCRFIRLYLSTNITQWSLFYATKWSCWPNRIECTILKSSSWT